MSHHHLLTATSSACRPGATFILLSQKSLSLSLSLEQRRREENRKPQQIASCLRPTIGRCSTASSLPFPGNAVALPPRLHAGRVGRP